MKRVPILATSVTEQLLTEKTSSAFDPKKDTKQSDKHHPVLINMITEEIGCSVDEIYDIELCVVDVTPACLGGAFEEFIFGARLDNQVGAYCSIEGLIQSCDKGSLEHDDSVRIAAIYDHEEVAFKINFYFIL